MPEGTITLPMMLGTPRHHLNLIINFMAVRVCSLYNIILGKPCMIMVKAILSTYYLVIKFLTKVGAEKVRGNQVMAQECYLVEIR